MNAPYFAGVADKPYAARTGGQFITINQPGSFCNVWSAASNTIGVGLSTCEAGTGGNGAGFFGRAGYPGRGTLTPLQTIDRSSTAGLCFGYLQDGEESNLIEEITPIDNSAKTLMVGGISYLKAATLTNGDCTYIIAAVTRPHQRKGVVTVGTQATNNVVVTIVVGVQADGSDTDYETWTTDTIADETHLKAEGVSTNWSWKEQLTLGGTIA